jgi:micrococcal nuclease
MFKKIFKIFKKKPKNTLFEMEVAPNILDNKIQYLEKTTQNTPFFSLKGYKLYGKCVKVYDGDTLHVNIYIFNSFYKFKVRLLGIDTPEIRTRDLEEKKRGYQAKKFVQDKILDKIIFLHCHDFDKYGRLLVEIFELDSDISINDILLEQKLAKKYIL